MGNMVNRGGKDGVGRQVVLVIGVACGVDLCFLCRVDGSCSGLVGTVSDYIRAVINHGLGCLLAKGRIGKGTGPRGLYLDVRVYFLCPVLKSVHDFNKGRTLNRSDKAYLSAFRHAGCQHSHDVSAFLALRHIGGHIVGGNLTFSHNELCIWILLRNVHRRIPELISMADDHVISAGRVIRKGCLNVIRCQILRIGHLTAVIRLQKLKPVIG